MQVKVSQTNLAAALKDVSRALSARAALPVLGHVLIEALSDQTVRLSATNLEFGIQRSFPAEVKSPGAITVPGKTFAELVNTLAGDIRLKLNDTKLVLKSESGQTTFSGIAAEEFPPFSPGVPGCTFTVKATDFKNVMDWTGFAVSTEEMRPVLTGVSMTGEKHTVTMRSADGFRAGRAILPASELSQPFAVVMPAVALSALTSMKVAAEGEIAVTVENSGRGVMFAGENWTFWLLTIEADFPDLDQVIPQANPIKALVSRAALLKAAKRAQILSERKIGKFAFAFPDEDPDQPTLQVRGESQEKGDTDTTLAIELFGGEAITIAFNTSFVIDIAQACPTEQIEFAMSVPTSPAVVRPTAFDGENAPLWLLMPMHLG